MQKMAERNVLGSRQHRKAQEGRVHLSALALCTTGPCPHSLELSPPWHGLTGFLKVILCHHVSGARVTPATPISEATSRHSYTPFVQKGTCNMLWQHSRAQKATKSPLFHSQEGRDKHHRKVLPVFGGTCKE